MIESIELQNFLSHKKTKMTFGQGVNAIVGATDAGKSAIIQGFRWVADNRPVGDGYRSNWGGTTKVIICTKNGSVTRIKSDSINKYIVRTKDQVLPLVGFGTKVPEPVLAFLNMTETNLQTQMETHYLLSKPLWSAGEVATHFNKIAHLHKIDIGRKNISSSIKVLERKIEADNTEVGRLKEELKEYNDLDIIESKIIDIEKIGVKLTETINGVTQLETLIYELKFLEQIIEEESAILPAGKLIDQVLNYQIQIDKQELEKDNLNKLVSDIRGFNYDIRHAEKFIKAEKLVDSLIELNKELQEKEDVYSELENTIHYLGMIISKESSLEKELKGLQKTFDDNMGKACILCGVKLKKKKL